MYLVFGADEEVGGLRGAAQVVKLLQERKVRLDFVIDEGLLITEGVMPGLKSPRRWSASPRRATCRWC